MIERLKQLLSSRRRIHVAAAVVLLALACGTALAVFRTHESHSDPKGARWIPVQPQALETRIGLVGRIEPATRLQITAPFEGNIKELAVTEGKHVEPGQTLLTLDTRQLDIQMREAMGELLKARRNVEKMKDWGNSDDVVRARRTVTGGEMALKNTKAKLADTRRLFERGIVARMEVDALEEQLETQDLDLTTARRELQSVMEKGQGENRQIAGMELANVQARYDALQALHEQRELRAPFAGLILRPPEKNENQDNSAQLQAGQLVKQGTPLLVLASTARLGAVARVEEADLHQLAENMPVEVTGDGFEGDVLKGRIVSIGLQGKSEDSNNRGGSATYDVTVSIGPLTAKQLKRVRLGMSARLTVVTYRAEKGFALPAEAVRRDENGQSFVIHRRSMGDNPKRITVTTGHAVPQGVEVSGIEPGYVELPAQGR